ncbi:hypothetical protein BSKO_03134 [Bryopsis sp. KO-2023]|nr:hypothetical protein BSKO_03134 [Bryopsis sp. KO-2023]
MGNFAVVLLIFLIGTTGSTALGRSFDGGVGFSADMESSVLASTAAFSAEMSEPHQHHRGLLKRKWPRRNGGG